MAICCILSVLPLQRKFKVLLQHFAANIGTSLGGHMEHPPSPKRRPQVTEHIANLYGFDGRTDKSLLFVIL